MFAGWGDAAGAKPGIARDGSAPDCAKLCTATVQRRKDERAREILPYPCKGKACGCGVIDAPAFRVENGRLDGSEAAFSAWVCSAGLDRNALLRGFQFPALTLEGCGLYSIFRRKKLSRRSFGRKRVAPTMSTWGDAESLCQHRLFLVSLSVLSDCIFAEQKSTRAG